MATLVTVHGDFRQMDLEESTVPLLRITLERAVYDGEGNLIILPSVEELEIVDGEVTFEIVGNGDPDLFPSGWAYRLNAYKSTSAGARSIWQAYYQFPYDAVGTIELGDLTPASTSSWATTYATAAQLAGKVDLDTVTTLGDLLVADGDGSLTRLGVGTNGKVLTANSAQPLGLSWATPSGGGGGGVVSVNGELPDVDGDIALSAADVGAAAASHTHTIANVTSLQTDLDALTAADVTLQADIDTRALSSALTSGLAGKEPTITAGTTGQYWRGDKSWQTLDKAAVALGNVANLSPANLGISDAAQTALNAKADASVVTTLSDDLDVHVGDSANPHNTTKTQVGLGNVSNLAPADLPISDDAQTLFDLKADLVGGVIPSAQLPAIAITEYLGTSANQAAMLAKVGQQGDWTIRSDTGTVWWITGSNPTVLGDWTEAAYPTAPVTSVNSQTGAVTLSAANVGALPTSLSLGTSAPLAGGGTLSGGLTLSLSDAGVTNAKLANMVNATIKGNNSGSTGAPIDLTAAQVKTLLGIGISDVSALQTALDGKTALSTLTTKGDLYVATASATAARQGVGSNGTILVADSAQTNGIKWGAPADITGFDTRVQTSRLDQMAAPTAAVSFSSQRLSSLAVPTAATDGMSYNAVIQLLKAAMLGNTGFVGLTGFPEFNNNTQAITTRVYYAFCVPVFGPFSSISILKTTAGTHTDFRFGAYSLTGTLLTNGTTGNVSTAFAGTGVKQGLFAGTVTPAIGQYAVWIILWTTNSVNPVLACTTLTHAAIGATAFQNNASGSGAVGRYGTVGDGGATDVPASLTVASNALTGYTQAGTMPLIGLGA